jgi:hypothetical protein
MTVGEFAARLLALRGRLDNVPTATSIIGLQLMGSLAAVDFKVMRAELDAMEALFLKAYARQAEELEPTAGPQLRLVSND